MVKLEEKIQYSLDMVAPERKYQTRPRHASWLTRPIRDEMKIRDDLLKVCVRTQDQEDWVAYKEKRNRVKHMCMQQKRLYNQTRLNVPDSRTMWNRVKNLSGLDKKSSAEKMKIRKEDSELLEKEKDISEHMNLYFKEKVVWLEMKTSPSVEKCEDYADEYVKDRLGGVLPPSFSFRTVGNHPIRKVIAGLKNTGAKGRDNIETEVLKKFSYVLIPYICHICNRSILSSIFPDGWKSGLIWPLPKKGSLSLASNWRPVVLNCALSKVLETILNDQLKLHLEESCLMSPVQHAYRRGRSCLSAWADLDTLVQDARN